MTKSSNPIQVMVSPLLLVAASRSGAKQKSPSARKAAPRRRATPVRSSSRPSQRTTGSSRGRATGERTLFHTPSFSAGVILGAMVVLIAAYAPEFLSGANSEETKAQLAPTPETSPEVTFEFDNLLRNSKVTADPGAYEVQGQTNEPGSIEYLIQAASFRHEAEAESLRAQLLLQDLPASTTSTRLDNAVWYRVTVGPFDSQVLAQRALTRLREQNLDALYIRRRKPT